MRMRPAVAIALVILAPCFAVAQQPLRLPQGPAGTVTLPVGDYDRLLDRAAQPGPRTETPPVPAVIARADLRATVSGTTARGTLRIEGEVLERGQVKVPLVAGATLIEARTDGRPLPLLQEGDAHAAVLPGASPFTLVLEWTAPVTTSPGRATFTLPVPAGGTISATIDLPGDPADVRAEPGVITRRQNAAGRTSIDVAVEPARRTQVSWSVRETMPEAPRAEARSLADVKSLVTIGDADLRLVSLIDVTVVRGEPRTFEVRLPAGFEVSAITGTSLETSAPRPGGVTLTVRDASQRHHQFLVSLEQPRGTASFKADTAFPSLVGTQREIGEIAIEAFGTVEVTAGGDPALRRMDVREVHSSLRSLARQPLLAAFRYQRRAEEARVLTLDVKRFADAPVIAAAAERAIATTLVTVEGRMLTEVQLTLRNRAQPFMKVTLPSGASMLSVEVAGETAKPVLGTDGTRVPLLRSGFRPDGPYNVSFVYLHSGQPLAKRGDVQMILPAMDVPVSVLEWELFLPDRVSAKPTAGNVIPAHLLGSIPYSTGYSRNAAQCTPPADIRALADWQIGGRVTDPVGCLIPGATITVRGTRGFVQQVSTDVNGFYVIHNVPAGRVQVTAELQGFRAVERSFVFHREPRQVDFQLEVAGLAETVTVASDAAAPPIAPREDDEMKQVAPSQNVQNLQRRVSGVLPVRIDVPRTGTAYRFVRPLVLEEQTDVTFRYKRRD